MVQKFDLVSGYMQEWSEGEWVTYEDYASLKEAAQKALDVPEDYEVKIDGEWGACRSIDQLYADGMVDDVLPLLKGLLRD